MTPEEIERVERICAELDGVEDITYLKNLKVIDGIKNGAWARTSYTSDLNEIFRLVREWCSQQTYSELEFNVSFSREYDAGIQWNDDSDVGKYHYSIHPNNPALALACTLVKAAGRWKEVESNGI